MSSAAPDLSPQPYRDCVFSVRDGLRLHYRDYAGSADRPPLLCLHGLTRNAADFADLAEHCAPDFRVIALDFRGRGRSDFDPISARYNPLTYAGDVLQLLDELQIPQAIFVGTSLGGLVTMTIAKTAPQRIIAAILNDVGPELSDEGLERIQTYVGKDVRFSSWDEAARNIAASNKSVPLHYNAEDWLAMARRICREEDGQIRFDYDMAIAEPFKIGGGVPTIDMWPLFKALAEKPLLVIRGEQSDLVTTDALARMEKAAPSAMFVTIPGVGHAPDLSEPQAVAAIDKFLRPLAG